MVTLALSLALLSSPLSPGTRLDQQILTEEALVGSVVSVSVTTETGKPVYEFQSTMRVVPASNQKVLTCLYALDTLGPDYTFQTRIWQEKGKLVIDAPGDPSLTLDQWREIRQKLPVGQSVNIVARQAFSVGVPDTWEFDDLPNRYAPRITALTGDKSGFEIWAEKGQVLPLPSELGVQVQSTYASGSPRVTYDVIRKVVSVNGAIPSARTRLDTCAMPEPDWTVARILGGPLSNAEKLPDYSPTFSLVSKPMSTLVKDCLQPSDNMYAEHLLLATTAAKSNKITSYADSRKALSEFLGRSIYSTPLEARPMDGSGLSRHNFVTTQSMTRLLNWARSQRWFPDFRSALAAPGVGTLRSRLSGVDFQGKTGTLSGVVGLSGYLRAKTGEDLTVSIIVNNGIRSSGDVQEAVDRIIRTLENTGSAGMEAVLH